MSVFAGKYTYKGNEITFWLTPKTIKATIWKPNSLILVKRLWVRSGLDDYLKLKNRVISFLDKREALEGDNDANFNMVG